MYKQPWHVGKAGDVENHNAHSLLVLLAHGQVVRNKQQIITPVQCCPLTSQLCSRLWESGVF